MNSFKEHEIVWNDEKIKRIWDYYSSNVAYNDQYFGYRVKNILPQKILKYVGDFSCGLDLSCGRGDILSGFFKLIKSDQILYGADVSQKSIDIVKERFRNYENFGGALNVADIDDSCNEKFDFILVTEVFEHLSDDDIVSMLGLCYRLLREKGLLVITTPNTENLNRSKTLCPECGCVFHRWQHQQSFTPEGLTHVLEKHLYKTVTCQELCWGGLGVKILSFLHLIPRTNLLYVGRKI